MLLSPSLYDDTWTFGYIKPISKRSCGKCGEQLQPEHLRGYFMERVRYYREQSIQLPRASDPRYIEMAEQNAKK